MLMLQWIVPAAYCCFDGYRRGHSVIGARLNGSGRRRSSGAAFRLLARFRMA